MHTHTQTFSSGDITLGAQQPINVDAFPLSMTTLAAIVTDGTAKYSVEFTLDDVNADENAAQWLTLTDIPVDTTGTAYASVNFPMTFVRINIVALSGAMEFKMLQAFDTQR